MHIVVYKLSRAYVASAIPTSTSAENYVAMNVEIHAASRGSSVCFSLDSREYGTDVLTTKQFVFCILFFPFLPLLLMILVAIRWTFQSISSFDYCVYNNNVMNIRIYVCSMCTHTHTQHTTHTLDMIISNIFLWNLFCIACKNSKLCVPPTREKIKSFTPYTYIVDIIYTYLYNRCTRVDTNILSLAGEMKCSRDFYSICILSKYPLANTHTRSHAHIWIMYLVACVALPQYWAAVLFMPVRIQIVLLQFMQFPYCHIVSSHSSRPSMAGVGIWYVRDLPLYFAPLSNTILPSTSTSSSLRCLIVEHYPIPFWMTYTDKNSICKFLYKFNESTSVVWFFFSVPA